MPVALWKNNYTSRKQYITVHHTAGPQVSSNNYTAVCNDGKIGYDFQIRSNGNYLKGQECGTQGEHALGCNCNHVGIVLDGCFGGTGCSNQAQMPTAAQESRLAWIWANLCTPRESSRLHPHMFCYLTQPCGAGTVTECCGANLASPSAAGSLYWTNPVGLNFVIRVWKASQDSSITC